MPQIANVASTATSSTAQPEQQAQQAHQATPFHDDGWSHDDGWTEWTGEETYYQQEYQEEDWYSWTYYAELVGQSTRVGQKKEDLTRLHGVLSFIFRALGTTTSCGYVAFLWMFIQHWIIAPVFALLSYMFSSVSTLCTFTESASDFTEHAFLNCEDHVEQCLLCEYIDLKTHPTFVILDSGCTRAMGSRFAVDRLVEACRRHPKSSNIYFTTQPCHSHFSFANGEQSHVAERLIIHFRNDQSANGWITTSVDILDKGQVPILFSVEQMRNLRMNIEHTPVGEFLTCPLFGMHKTALAVSTSNHKALDIMSLALASNKPQHSFATAFAVTCPACLGKHRPHTNKEGCKKFSEKTPASSSKKAPEPVRDDVAPRRRMTRTYIDAEKVAMEPPEPQSDLPPDPDEFPADEPFDQKQEESEEKVEPETVEPKVKAEPKVKVEEKKEPGPKMTLPLALKRIHDKLSSPTEHFKLHLKHYHMSPEQFRRRTSALKLPKEIYDLYENIAKGCETCQKAKVAPARAKVSGIRSEIFGELTFVDHGEIKIDERSKVQFIIRWSHLTYYRTCGNYQI